MKTAEALRRLRTKGTLRGDTPLANSLQSDALNQPVARAAADLVAKCESAGRRGVAPMFPPSAFIPLLP